MAVVEIEFVEVQSGARTFAYSAEGYLAQSSQLAQNIGNLMGPCNECGIITGFFQTLDRSQPAEFFGKHRTWSLFRYALELTSAISPGRPRHQARLAGAPLCHQMCAPARVLTRALDSRHILNNA